MTAGAGEGPYERHPVAAEPADVVSALRALLEERGATLYSVVDHGRDMAAAGAPGFTAWTVIFGNPAAGARLLAQRLTAAVDIPLRLAVVAGEQGGSEIVLRDMGTLLDAPLAELAEAFTETLRGLARAAAERAAG